MSYVAYIRDSVLDTGMCLTRDMFNFFQSFSLYLGRSENSICMSVRYLLDMGTRARIKSWSNS